MTCTCGRFTTIMTTDGREFDAWGDRERFPRWIASGACDDCGDILHADGSITRRDDAPRADGSITRKETGEHVRLGYDNGVRSEAETGGGGELSETGS